MSFATALNCIDGRVQEPVIEYVRQRFHVEHVDVITEPGVNAFLVDTSSSIRVEHVFDKLRISIERHHSAGIAVAGHHDCAANPASRTEQESQIRQAMQMIRSRHADIEIIGLWVDECWAVSELPLRAGTL